MSGSRLAQVIVLVEDLGQARRDMQDLGFRVDEGGRHPGRGTANLIVPLGQEYIELLAIVDVDEARASADGRPVLAALGRGGPGVARWSVEPSDIAAVGRRLALPVEQRRRIRSDGVEITWRAVGVNEAWASPDRCAFMAWDDAALRPAGNERSHPNGATAIASLTVECPDPAAARDWLGGDVPVAVTLTHAVGRGPAELIVATAAGEQMRVA